MLHSASVISCPAGPYSPWPGSSPSHWPATQCTSHPTLAGRIGFAAVLGGALTNLIDRAADGVVTDYFHTGWFPTFNLADTFITIGVVLIVLDVLRQEWSAPRDAEGIEPSRELA
ncbi:signal peptidase II (plasmid) [Gordonia rubripertincta]|uniref:signal peptidase II n=1 Tax=Gordonia rubripertincta TaxID=36822 RepID=UPI0039B449BA